MLFFVLCTNLYYTQGAGEDECMKMLVNEANAAATAMSKNVYTYVYVYSICIGYHTAHHRQLHTALDITQVEHRTVSATANPTAATC